MKSVPEMVCQIVKAKKAYYGGDKPIMSDYDYDALEGELKKLDPRHPIIYAVGYDDSYDWWLDHYDHCLKAEDGKHKYVPAPDSFEQPYCKHCYKGS